MSVGEHEIDAVITGRVQGVNFRRFVKERADELGVTGYVCNRVDGSVEVVAQGEKDVLELLVAHMRKGPYFAEVEDVYVDWYEMPQDAFTDFHIEVST